MTYRKNLSRNVEVFFITFELKPLQMKILFIIVISILFCIILLLYWKFLKIYEEIMIEKYNLTDKEIETHNKRCRHANYDCSLKDYLN